MAKKTVQIAGRDYVVAPLNLRQIREFIIEPSALAETAAETQRRAIGMCAASMANAGGATSASELEEALTLSDFRCLQQAVLEVSELVQGENRPAADSTSGASTGIS